jgi:glucose/arabinose dehydrogenase
MRKPYIVGVASALFVAATAGSCLAQGKIEGPVEPVAAAPAAEGWKATPVVEGLERPWGMVFLPDGETMLISEKPGRLRLFRDGQLVSEPIAGLPKIFARGQGGLMDVSLHPSFADTRWVYFTYSAGTSSENHTQMARGTLSDDMTRLNDVEVLFEVNKLKEGGQHFGSRIEWLPDDTMLLSIGDGGNPPIEVNGKLARFHAQDLQSHLGKILRLDENGRPAPANPFMSDTDNAGAIYTYGHRNVQGISIHPETGDIWATEHGARGGDELNLIEAGNNYGWPIVTYSYEYFGPRISQDTTMPEAEDPKVVWTPCIAPSGLAFYTGDAIGDWTGDLFAGGLVLKQIRRIKFEDGQPTTQETLQFPSRIRDVVNGPDGHLYVLTDEKNGQVLRIDVDQK